MILEAITHYCNYQLRSHKEVRNKLYELGCAKPEVEKHIADLIQAGLLNEEKYARAIARGKFRMKQWGRIKIVQQLKFNQVSDYCIKKALTEIDPDEYYETLKKLALKKWESLRSERQKPIKQKKTYSFLAQKGYEGSLITEAINEIINIG